MQSLRVLPKALRPSCSQLRSCTARARIPFLLIVPSNLRSPRPSLYILSRESSTSSQKDPRSPQESKSSSVEAISSTLQDADSAENNLLSPVHIPEDPHGGLPKHHPAMSILANSSLVITRQLELMNVMVGFEQANKYVIMDAQGQHIGFIAEKDLGVGSTMKRQMFGTRRSFETHIFDKIGTEVLRVSVSHHRKAIKLRL